MEEESEKIASLIESLQHPDKKVIRQAAETLISIAPSMPQLSEMLNRLLSETPEERRWPIAYILAHLPNPSSLSIRVLLNTIGSQDPDIRWAAAVLLARLGKSDQRIVTLLLDLLKTGTPTQRRMAVYCLRDMDLRDTASLQAVHESLRDTEPLVRVAAVTSLKSRLGVGKETLDFLLHLFLTDPDSRVRYAAALTLAELGAANDKIRTALEAASQSEDPQLKKVANAALALLKKKGPPHSGSNPNVGGPVVS